MTYSFNDSKLRGRIIEKFGTLGSFATATNRDRTSISLMLSGKRRMKREDMALFSSFLEIGKEEIGDYFFNYEVVKS